MTTRVPVFSRKGERIQTIDDWKRLASTEGKWADGYSAKELGRLWLSGRGPAVASTALAPALPGLTITRAIAEAQISFDQYPGGVRNHDVLAYGTADCGEVVIGVEGKVNETLDETLAEKYERARRRVAQGKNTNLDKRVDALLDAIVGKEFDAQPSLAALRYQLFSALAGTVAAATPATAAAAVVVHLIRSPLASTQKFAETRKAVAEFSVALGLGRDDDLVGPIRLKKAMGEARVAMPIWLAVVETGTA